MSAFNLLQRKGIPSKFLYFPDENHWVLKPANSILWHDTVLAGSTVAQAVASDRGAALRTCQDAGRARARPFSLPLSLGRGRGGPARRLLQEAALPARRTASSLRASQ